MGIFDRFSRLFADTPTVEPQRKINNFKGELGESGTQIFHGIITEDYNPDFQFPNSVRIYQEMRKSDATVNGVLLALKLPILSAEYTIEPFDAKDTRSVEQAEFVRKTLENIEGGFKQFQREALNHLDFGFYYFEKVYAVDENGAFVLKKLAPRLPSAHYLWQTSKGPGVTQQLPATKDPTKGTTREIPAEKLVLFVNNKEGDNYEGTAILRSAYKHYFYKDLLYRLDGVKHERGAGILTIELPEGSSDDDQARAEELGRNFKVNEQAFIIKPKGWGIEMLTSGIESQSGPLMQSVAHHDRKITMNILAQFLDLGAGKSGSFALSKDQTSFFTLALRAVARYFEDVVNEQIIKQLIDFNYGPQENYPKMRFQEIGEVDYDEMSQVIERLLNVGVVKNDPKLKVWIHKTFGLPEVTLEDFEDEEEVEDEPEIEDEPGEPRDDDEPMGGEMSEKRKKKAFANGKYFRELTLAETRVKLAEIEDVFDEQEQEVTDYLAQDAQTQKEAMTKQVESIIRAGAIGLIAGITAKKTNDLIAFLKDVMNGSVESGAKNAAKEIGASVPTISNFTKKVVDTKATLIATQRAKELETMVQGKVLELLNNEVGVKPAMQEVNRVIDETLGVLDKNIAGTVVVDNYDEGRALTFEAHIDSIHGLQRSEVLDEKTCNVCMSLDGRVLEPTDPFTNLTQVHSNCRGLWVAVLKTDAELPVAKKLPKSISNRFEKTEGVPSINAFKQLKKPVITKDSRAQQAINDGEIE